MAQLISKVVKLLDVKSIVTLSLVFGFIYMSLGGLEIPKVYETLLTTVIAFYFGVKYSESKDTSREDIKQ